ncbi:hypothetical protein D9611_009584 [Ephemerocybe angulata]|uniref:Uncharacterized protein n=1 Tax=Ephemerocybe angulata TaxID=980116 RepID=A0A8H5FGK2_9AGAR|nr:hypothetical protein D9611_009584 [Tulosesus angulatus]
MFSLLSGFISPYLVASRSFKTSSPRSLYDTPLRSILEEVNGAGRRLLISTSCAFIEAHDPYWWIFTDELEVNLEKAMADRLSSTGSVPIKKRRTARSAHSSPTRRAQITIARSSRNSLRSLAGVSPSSRSEVRVKSRLGRRRIGLMTHSTLRVRRWRRAFCLEEVWRFSKRVCSWLRRVRGMRVRLLRRTLRATTNFDQELGVAIIRRAITNPARTIYKNAGEETSVIVGRILSEYGVEGKFNWEYDAGKGEYVDMVERGVVDPLKVVRTALVGAAGVASLLTTSEASVVEAAEEEGAKGPAGMGGWEGFEG